MHSHRASAAPRRCSTPGCARAPARFGSGCRGLFPTTRNRTVAEGLLAWGGKIRPRILKLGGGSRLPCHCSVAFNAFSGTCKS